ncbi:MAG TPA: PilZ domain-containing protein [Blastocatellia bacterium]|nr:PilZ domain-containing protein [Blastocatellia bacterium]
MQQRAARIESEVNRILDCINSRSDHYKVLNVNRSAPIEAIRQSYCRAVELLHPLNCQDIIGSDGAMRWKLSQVFLRIVEAFSALSQPARRAQYDAEINRRPIIPLPVPPIPESAQIAGSQVAGLAAAGPSAGISAERAAVALEAAPLERARDRRRASRLALSIPVRVTSVEGNWREVTESQDVSRTGLKLLLRHPVERGSPLRLELPMPLVLRNHSHNNSLYRVRAVVRHIEPAPIGGYIVGLEFEASTADMELTPR